MQVTVGPSLEQLQSTAPALSRVRPSGTTSVTVKPEAGVPLTLVTAMVQLRTSPGTTDSSRPVLLIPRSWSTGAGLGDGDGDAEGEGDGDGEADGDGTTTGGTNGWQFAS